MQKGKKGTFMYYFTGHGSLAVFCEKILQLLFPMGTYCMCCGSYIDLTRTYCICDKCMDAINWGYIYLDLKKERAVRGRTNHLDSVDSCMVYGLHSRQLVFDLKYNKRTYLARPISMIMADRLLKDPEPDIDISDIDFVIPVPLHGSKLKSRGFNQAALISAQLTKRLNEGIGAKKIRHLEDGLIRSRMTSAQRGISGGERFANLEGAFSVNPKRIEMIRDKNILLVDDIFTTGSTADSCAKALKEAGASKVHFISLATGNYYLKGSFRPRADEEFLEEL